MENEPIDPMYKYIDAKIEAATAEQKKALLLTQRVLANFMIYSNGNQIKDKIVQAEPEKATVLVAQLAAAIAKADTQIELSSKPLDIAITFRNKWFEQLKKLNLAIEI